MKTASGSGPVFQGDVMFQAIERLPADAKELPRKEGEALVVAHSETGHHHVIRQREAVLYGSGNPLVCYLQLNPGAEIEHLRPWDTHETIQFKAPLWKVTRQRESTPEGWRRVED